MKFYYIIIGLLFSTFLLRAQEVGDQLFEESMIHEIRISSSDQDLLSNMSDTFLAEFGGEYSYREVDVEIDGNLVSSVGVRVKGGLTAFDNKKPLKLDFNEFVLGQSYNGVKKVNLHNVYFDRSAIREALSYDVLRTAGLKAPRTAFTEVYINDDLQGLYLIVEQVDKTFLNNYFADNSGVLYKDDGCFISIKGDSGTLDAYEEFESALLSLSGEDLKNALDGVINIDALIQQLLLQNLMNTVDNIYSFNCNYYIYHEPKSSLLYYIPWDFNLSLFNGVNNNLNVIENNFFSKLYDIPSYLDKHYEFACQTLGYNFTEQRLFDKIDAYLILIEGAIKQDPIFPYTYEDVVDESSILKNTIQDRVQTFTNNLDDLGYNCAGTLSPIESNTIVINEIMCSSDSISGIEDGTGSYPDWIELYNTSDEVIDLTDVYLSDDKDFLKHWKFPNNTFIGANEYLIVWADRDLDENGLHVDFKLSKSIGQLFLVNENLSIIDSVNYNQQTTNISYARIPNGIGNFEQRNPTFNENNDVLSLTETQSLVTSYFPNPVSDYFHINLKEACSIKLFDFLGNQILDTDLSSGKQIIPLQKLSCGSYSLVFSTAEYIQSIKLIKL